MSWKRCSLAGVRSQGMLQRADSRPSGRGRVEPGHTRRSLDVSAPILDRLVDRALQRITGRPLVGLLRAPLRQGTPAQRDSRPRWSAPRSPFARSAGQTGRRSSRRHPLTVADHRRPIPWDGITRIAWTPDAPVTRVGHSSRGLAWRRRWRSAGARRFEQLWPSDRRPVGGISRHGFRDRLRPR
jgi:hypothetical protein